MPHTRLGLLGGAGRGEMTKLKSCPFCGGDARIAVRSDVETSLGYRGPLLVVGCDNEGCEAGWHGSFQAQIHDKER